MTPQGGDSSADSHYGADSSLDLVRTQLESGDPRQHLAALVLLTDECTRSKSQQQAVGTFLRGPTSNVTKPTKLLQIVLADLHACDRTLRCAAARLICHLAHENLVNQESIMQYSRGITIGWLHVFSVPQSYSSVSDNDWRQQQQCQRAQRAFLHDTLVDQYASVYDDVTRYYASGCETDLPICWTPSRPGDMNMDDVLDPADHLLGFYLVPRQTQFPESDDCYLDELLQPMDDGDRAVIENVKRGFDKAAAASKDVDTVVASAFIQYCSHKRDNDRSDLAWLISTENPTCVAPIDAYFASTGSELTWNQVLTYATVLLNSARLHEAFGSTVLIDVASLFGQLSATNSPSVTSNTWVWLPVLVNRIVHSPALPERFKRHVRTLHRELQPTPTHQLWRVLVPMKAEQVSPVTWALFLAQWRDAMELERRLGEQNVSAPHRTSVIAVSSLRKSIVQQIQPHSYRDLEQLRRQLPAAYRSASQQSLPAIAGRSLPSFREELDVNHADELAKEDQQIPTGLEKVGDESSLEYNLELFHRMQQSLAELDAVSRQRLESKQRDKARLRETVATNKQLAELAREQRRQQLQLKDNETQAKLSELEQRKAARRAVLQERQQRKHDDAARRKQRREEELEARQQELADKLAQRDQELTDRRQPPTLSETPTDHHIRPTRPVPRRPQSAGPSRPTKPTHNNRDDVSPEQLRQRALLYGQVVSKIYTASASARSPSTEPAMSHQPHHITRSFSIYRSASFNVKAPVVKASPRVRKARTPRVRQLTEAKEIEAGYTGYSQSNLRDEGDEEDGMEGEEVDATSSASWRRKAKAIAAAAIHKPTERPPQLAHDNACSTLVMRNAALAVSARIRIPDVPAPAVDEASVPPYVIAAQYEALDDVHKRNFRDRFNLKCVSHRLSYAVLKQYTKMVRREMAWQAFHDRCSGPGERIKYGDFVAIAQALGVALSDKKLLPIARQLDRNKSGCIEWKAFYT